MVVVVDTDAAWTRRLTAALSEEHIKAACADTVEDAVRAVLRTGSRLVAMELHLRGDPEEARRLMEVLRAYPETRDVRVMIVSSVLTDAIRDLLRAAGIPDAARKTQPIRTITQQIVAMALGTDRNGESHESWLRTAAT